jgi:anthranilate/para-aminobenzoate synthase component II
MGANNQDVTLMIDNYDSFTYNIVQYLCQLGANVIVKRNDEITVEEALKMNPVNVVISPGPGNPSEAGVSKDIIRAFAGKVPVLGVCLGHQAIVELYGGDIVRCAHIMHGKCSPVMHDSKGVYYEVEKPHKLIDEPIAQSVDLPQFVDESSSVFDHSFLATRYHSLVAKPETLPDCLLVTSYVEEPIFGVNSDPSSMPSVDPSTMGHTIMGVRHRQFTVEGVQYHPESVCSANGFKLFENFLRLRGGEWKTAKLV